VNFLKGETGYVVVLVPFIKPIELPTLNLAYEVQMKGKSVISNQVSL